MDSHMTDYLDTVFKRLDLIQKDQSKFDRVIERLETVQNILESWNQKQCLLDKKLEILTNFDSLLDKKLSTMAYFDNLLDKKHMDLTNCDEVLDKKLSNITPAENVLDKRLSDVTIVNNLLDKRLSDVTSVNNLLDKRLSDVTSADNLLDKRLSDVTSVNNLLDKRLSDVTSADNLLDKRLFDVTSADNLLDKRLSELENVDNVLDTKRCDLTQVFRQESLAILQAIKDTGHEIMGRLCDVPLPANDDVSQLFAQEVQTTSTEQHQTQCGPFCVDDVHETEETLGKVDQKTTTQATFQSDSKCQIENQSEVNTGQEIKREGEEIGRVLCEIYSIPDLVRAQTRAELVWLDSQINHKLDATEANVNFNLQLITQEINKNTAQSELIVNALKEREIIPKEINSSVMSRSQNVDALIAKITMEELQLLLDNRQKIITEELLAFSLRQNSLEAKIENCAQDVKNYMYKIKREIFAVTEKEAQIVRDRIEGQLPCHGEYLFDLYVDNFKKMVRSEREAHSPPWHINEMKSSMMGMTWFSATGDMEVCFVFARHPREMGLQPKSAIKLKVRSTICDIHKKVLPNVDVGEKVWTVKERNITCNFEWGCKLGILPCDELLEKGYGDKEEYRFGAVLVRFHVTVC